MRCTSRLSDPGRYLARRGSAAPDGYIHPVIVLGVVLLIIGFVLGIQVLWIVGLILALVGAVLAIAGSAGRAVGGRSHWY